MTLLTIIAIVTIIWLIGIKAHWYGHLVNASQDICIVVVLIFMQSAMRYYHYSVKTLDLTVPYTMICVGAYVYVFLSIKKYYRLGKQEINRNSIREAFDDLPSGVCFFNESGIPVLCNRTMYQLIYQINDGKYLKTFNDFPTQTEITLKNNHIWHFTHIPIKCDQKTYLEIVATDITELHRKTEELKEDNQRLKEMKNHMNDLTKNVKEIAREEEILTMKMKMHDDIGACVLVSHRFFLQERPMSESKDIIYRWKKAIGVIQRDNEYLKNEINRFQQLKDSAIQAGVDIVVTGKLPEHPEDEYLLICAIRECVTNTIKHAEGDCVYVSINREYTGHMSWYKAMITNNGKAPTQTIKEGMGLSGLRQKIERAGGSLEIISQPDFEMIVKIPEGR